MITHILDIPVEKLTQDYVRIENLRQYLFEVEKINPVDLGRYIPYWRDIKQLVIEGTWGEESTGYRYMFGDLLFYGNFCVIQRTNAAKVTEPIKPLVRDLDWEMCYGVNVASGFSGFSDDEQFTSDRLVLDYEKTGIPTSVHEELKIRHMMLFNSKGELKHYIDPLTYLKKTHHRPLGKALWYNEAVNFSTLGSRGGGKQILLDELVKVEDGWKTMRDLQVGDKIYGQDGKLYPVLAKSDAEESDYFNITFRDGRQIEACKDHTWKVWEKNKNKKKKGRHRDDNFTTMSTQEISERYYIDRYDSRIKSKTGELVVTRESMIAVPTNECLEQQEKNLPIDPYVLGLLLGDGSMTKNISVESMDEEILNYLTDFCTKNNWTYRNQVNENKRSNSFFITNKKKEDLTIKDILGEMGLAGTNSYNKFIPDIYLNSSEEQRLELLRGLMDTDGFADNTHIEYYTISEVLAKNFADLVRSLGISCRVSTKETSYKKNGVKVPCKLCYRISLYTDKKVFKLERKQKFVDSNNLKSKAGKSKWSKNFIVDVQPTGKKVGACIMVGSPDSTYITKDFIVTHNSYFFSLGKGLHAIVTDGAKYYNNLDGKYYKDPLYREEYSQPIAEIMVGSGNSDKSSEFAIKMQFAMNQFATNPDFGVWGKEGDEDHTPIPFFKQMVGSIGPNNKENPWRHEYSVINKGREIKKGSKSKLYHVSYFEGKAQGKGSQAGAGGRVLYSFTEESGLTGNTIEIHNSNKFVVSRDGVQFGVQVDLGTSGNIESVQQTKKKFMNPHDYDILPYKDPEGLGQYGDIGFFLPFYLTLNFCKDEDGNTIYEKAFAETLKRREKAAQSTDPSVLREEKMNAPILPSEMWISKKGYYLPYDEAVNRQKDLSKNGLFMDLGTPARFIWDSKQPYGVKMEPELDLQPYYNFPIESNRMTKEAPPVIYEHPIYIHGEIPQGMYFSVYDPYVSDNLEDGGSLGTTFILLAPLYWDEYLTDKGPIVATYTAKHAEGLDGYHEVQEKLLAYYGNQDNAHYYEKNRGRSCRDYYIKKGKAYMLGLQPGTYDSSSTVAKRIAEYGISVPNGPKKIQMLDETSDWLKSEVITKNGDVKRVIELMSCKFTVDQIVDFSIDKASNYDAVSALILIPTVIKEREFFFTEKVTGKNKSNPLNFLTSNERLWSRRN